MIDSGGDNNGWLHHNLDVLFDVLFLVLIFFKYNMKLIVKKERRDKFANFKHVWKWLQVLFTYNKMFQLHNNRGD